jgi:serine O-acetyltransferase
LFIPHPNGIVTGGEVQLENDVVLLQQVTLGCRSAYAGNSKNDGDPTLKEGVYVGPGAKILGRITVGEWSIVGANAVITENVPAYSIVVGHNKLLPTTTKEL